MLTLIELFACVESGLMKLLLVLVFSATSPVSQSMLVMLILLQELFHFVLYFLLIQVDYCFLLLFCKLSV